jgi:hypothetical protein
VSVDECRALQRRLSDDLAVLRTQFQEAVANYSVRVQGMLAEAGDTLAGDDPARLGKAELEARVHALREVLHDVEHVHLKPTKGRRKDLRAVQRVADRVGEVVSDW